MGPEADAERTLKGCAGTQMRGNGGLEGGECSRGAGQY